ncbi:acyl-CoA dehydrogenase family protein [Mycobacterium montefiorense]|uniref:acyl-CoA dehydrogenase family protein n=2 Tax=Mycobacterium montefiorense TaxID=154654 RepID=UPI0021F352B5|nr:acyl-CoA dehydrogenase family protein [Mycobacterium montefiorense]MCV7425961.1 acyl-CoA/acyl-ACP dehydrogenase [Mycobacterium montefiorense]
MTAAMGSAPTQLDSRLLEDIRAHAGALDRGEYHSRRSFVALGSAALLGVGAPGNADGRLPEMADVIRLISAECMSTGFSLWAHRMTVEYLLTAATPFSNAAATPLLAGTALGVSGMAATQKEVTGCGSLELTATPVAGGYEISGPIRWASNLYTDSIMVTGVRTDDGERLIIAVPLDTLGIEVGDPFDLLAMGSTASSYVHMTAAYVPAEQVLSRDLKGFLQAVRPTMLILQSAMCLGLTRTCVDQSRLGLAGTTAVLRPDLDRIAGGLAQAEATLAAVAAAVGGARPPTTKDLLSLRLSAGELVSASADLELRTAGGNGYATRTSTSRHYREAAFVPVQSPSEAQLRWELSRCA